MAHLLNGVTVTATRVIIGRIISIDNINISMERTGIIIDVKVYIANITPKTQ
jgi:hypothetical protein